MPQVADKPTFIEMPSVALHPSHSTTNAPPPSFTTSTTSSASPPLPSLPPHKEGSQRSPGHGRPSTLIRDSILGFADGLTVPFALTAGLSTLGSARLVILAGLAELCSGALSMGLGAYLAAATEQKSYGFAEQRARRRVRDEPEEEEVELYAVLAEYGVGREAGRGVVEELRRRPEQWVNFMMAFDLQLEKPSTSQNWMSALVMGSSYFIGGLIPMIPYFAFRNVNHALFTSVGITVVILLIFGYVKAVVTGTTRIAGLWSALQTLVVGALAAGASYAIVRGVNSAKGIY